MRMPAGLTHQLQEGNGPARLAAMLAGLIGVAAAGAAAGAQPTFRARTDLVRVDALVTQGGTPVRGLGAADFEVRDNGVPQRVTAARAVGSVRLGVVLDASGSMTGERLGLARAATADLLSQLQAGDGFVLLAFGDQVARLGRPGAPAADALAALDRLRAAGGTALVDALHAGIVEADDGPGPKLLLLMTDGRNNASWLQAGGVIDVARRHETVVYPVAVGVDRQWARTSVLPSLRTSDSHALLRVIADETGGRHIEAGWDAGLGTVFRQILDEYRQRYVLTFTPEGVSTGDGWHALEVKVTRRGARVRARTRYWAGTGE